MPRKTSTPSYYKLKSKNNAVRACLATDFSAYKATDEEELFNRTKTVPTRINNEKLFSKVVLLSNDTEKLCPGKEGDGTDMCESGAGGHFETDEKVNFLSLTVLGLRILFLKSIIFNVLMTLRACMS
ncbi:hypothetical protein SKAU_G00200890 [Synaphobranchus kaupii]|uniref:Uncharacterized protein n=1 Tax=Synaphobranchus kaupii TaxID=118154 RepID=A0A9Q1IYD8_SYNKA|nr:hypothetical protein SKAU_G00200890 [Synaphobranchus kaupii]